MVGPGSVREAPGCIRVLAVDDEPSVRGALELAMLAFEDMLMVGLAENGAQAVDLCGQLEPDVVLMDMKLPVMDGFTATRLIRRQYPHIQVVGLSNYCGDEHSRQAWEAGVCRCLSKCVTSDEIVEAIRAATGSAV